MTSFDAHEGQRQRTSRSSRVSSRISTFLGAISDSRSTFHTISEYRAAAAAKGSPWGFAGPGRPLV